MAWHLTARCNALLHPLQCLHVSAIPYPPAMPPCLCILSQCAKCICVGIDPHDCMCSIYCIRLKQSVYYNRVSCFQQKRKCCREMYVQVWLHIGFQCACHLKISFITSACGTCMMHRRNVYINSNNADTRVHVLLLVVAGAGCFL